MHCGSCQKVVGNKENIKKNETLRSLQTMDTFAWLQQWLANEMTQEDPHTHTRIYGIPYSHTLHMNENGQIKESNKIFN